MRIDKDFPASMESLPEDRLGAVSAMTGLSLDRREAFVTIDTGLLGAKGEVLGSDRRVFFRSDRGLRKAKKVETIPYGEVTSVAFDGTGPFFRWTFSSEKGSFDLGLVNYEGRNGLGAREIFWYDLEEYPVRSGLFCRAARLVLSRSAALSLFDHPALVSRRIEEAVTAFETSPRLMTQSISQPDPYYLWSGVFDGFCSFVAGATLSGEEDESGWVELFLSLDGIYARILSRFLKEIEDLSGPSLSKETAIFGLGDMFDRLTAIWYARQIARLHFAGTRIDRAKIREWDIRLLTPRALQAGGKLSIKLRERSMYEEEIRLLQS